jgi:hypothetical protein
MSSCRTGTSFFPSAEKRKQKKPPLRLSMRENYAARREPMNSLRSNSIGSFSPCRSVFFFRSTAKAEGKDRHYSRLEQGVVTYSNNASLHPPIRRSKVPKQGVVATPCKA